MSARPFLIVFAAFTSALLTAVSGEEVDFARDIQPIFAQHCLECHGPDEQESGLRLDQRDSILAKAQSGERPVVAGNAAAGELLIRIRSSDPDVRMPPEGKSLSASQIGKIEQWILGGAEFSQHWAYRPLVSSPLPSVQQDEWCASPIDYFVLAQLESQGLTPSPPADRYTLVKRLYYDLLGLPAPVEEVDRFAKDPAESAYEGLVERLLASPRFGERWGRHWLDKARYADSDGYEKDNPRPHAWHFRDWVIAQINADLPFDRFTIEQLAGDLVDEANDSNLLATAFNRQTLTNTEGGTDKEQWRVAAVMDRTETLGTVWLGLTVGCARCHSHKYDQISQDEYYQLYAFFNNGDETTREITTPSRAKQKVRLVTQRHDSPRTTKVLRRGDFLQPQHEVFANTLGTLPRFESRAGKPSQADRLDLAHWLVSGDNPLPPRVAVNHVWKHLFGHGLVRTTNDFGIRGEPPTHPRLLDWLATELVRRQWSRKDLIRAILLSSTYQQSSQHRAQLLDVDPENRLLHRQNRFRVEGEIVRDITLSAAELLSTEIGGPSVFPPIPASVTDLTYNSSFKWEVSKGEARYRRGMYTFFKRTAPHPNLITFDCPDSNVTAVDRERSNTPIGALVTLNNEVYVEAARAIARRSRTTGDQFSELRRVMRVCLARVPGDHEVEPLHKLLRVARKHYQDHPKDAEQLVGERDAEWAAWLATVRVVLNLDEFITRE